MSEVMTQLRERIDRAEIRGGKKFFSDELKREVVQFAKAQRSVGITQSQLARQLGLGDSTLAKWCREAVATAGRPVGGFAEITTRPDTALTDGFITVPIGVGAPFELVSPKGYQVRVPVQFDAAALRRLMAVLEA